VKRPLLSVFLAAGILAVFIVGIVAYSQGAAPAAAPAGSPGGSSGGSLAGTLPGAAGGSPAGSSSSLPARQPARTAGGPNVALLDVSYVFDQLPRFKQVMNDMKKDVDNAEAAVKAETQSIQKLTQDLESKKGTADYRRMEEQITTRRANLAAQVETQRREFLQREAKIYYDFYRQIQMVVNDFCAANGIDIVLRFNTDPVDPETPQSVLSYINRPVVTYTRDRDITPDVLDIMIRRSAPAGGTTVPAVGGRSGTTTPSLPLR
jgi:Skp family chaperone for outer membrane proteins